MSSLNSWINCIRIGLKPVGYLRHGVVRLLPYEAVPLTHCRGTVMDPITLVISITAGLLQAAYWGTRLYRLYRIKKA